MKIKIIDLLNKIAKGEDTPNELKYGDLTFIKNNIGFYQDEYGFNLTAYICHDYSNLNDEIEIIEETVELPKEYKIPEIESADNKRILQAEIKINKIISYLKSKEEGKEK